MSTTSTPVRTVSVAVKADPEAIWHALVDRGSTPAYYFGFEGQFDLTPGASYRYTAGGGDVIVGTVVEVDPGRRLVTSFRGLWAPDVAELPESTVTFTLSSPAMPMPGVTIVTMEHAGLPQGEVGDHLESGWVAILSGLKTLLETGAPLVGAA